MPKRRVCPTEIAVGEAVPWDIHCDEGNLLLRKGHIVSSLKQLDVLVLRGLRASHIHPVPDLPEPKKPPSVLRMLNAVNHRLTSLLHGMITEHDNKKEQLLQIAKFVVAATDLNPNVALACILHNQKVGSYAIRHCIDSAVVSLLIARAMKKAPAEVLVITAASLTMNIGMLEQQERMQVTREKLSDADRDAISQHPQHSVDLLRRAGVDDDMWLMCVLLHHETENGTGYPFGKRGHEIPVDAKIISLADRYCARVSARQYRKSLVPNAALRDLMTEGKETIDMSLISTFIKELGIYPTGTFVRLENGEIGVVTAKGKSTTTPIVDSLVGPRGAPLDEIIRRDTSKTLCGIREVLNEYQAGIGFRLDQLWGPVAEP